MTKLQNGYLIFTAETRLSTVHKLASQIGCTFSSAQILDVGLLSDSAWIATWTSDMKEAEEIKSLIHGEFVKISSGAVQALMSLGPSLPAETSVVGLLEVMDTKELSLFFNRVSECENCGWIVLEIRIRRAGLAGAHAYFAKTERALSPNMAEFIELKLDGDYKKFF